MSFHGSAFFTSHGINHPRSQIMTKWIFILCIALLQASCSSIWSSKPSGTLSEKQMTDVLVDIHLTEAALKIVSDTSARLDDTNYLRSRFAEIFEKHDIKPDEFAASLNYYMLHIDDLDKIYTEVINRLTELEAMLQPKPVAGAGNTGDPRLLNNNIWYRSTYKITAPFEIHYFGPLQYPVKLKVNYPQPIREN